MAQGRILVVEDEPANMELVVDLLEVAGYEVLQSTTAEDGISTAKSAIPDIILMDINLPDMDGLKATKILKADPVTANIPVIAFTASVTTEDLNKYLGIDFASIIKKPINTREFAKQVAAFMPSKE